MPEDVSAPKGHMRLYGITSWMRFWYVKSWVTEPAACGSRLAQEPMSKIVEYAGGWLDKAATILQS